MKKDAKIQIRVEAELREGIEQYCKDNSLVFSEFVRNMIRKEFNRIISFRKEFNHIISSEEQTQDENLGGKDDERN